MKADITVREVKPEDIETIAAIAVAAWEPIYAAYLEDMGKDLFDIMHSNWRMTKAVQIKLKAKEHPNQVYVSEMNDRVIGFTSFSVDEKKKIGEIGNNAVLPELQGYGIGRLQHEKVLDMFRKNGLRYATVSTGLDEGHKKARVSYEKNGFKRMKWSITYFQEL